MEVTRFVTWDYLSMSALCLLTCAPGIVQMYRARKTKTVKEFISLNRNSGVAPISVSLAASMISSIMMISASSEIFRLGIVFLFCLIGVLLTPLIGNYVYLPVFYASNCASVFEFVENRFNRFTRRFFSAINIFRSAFSSGFVIYVTALALSQATGFNLWSSVLSISLICIIYSSLGGFKAVIFTDVLQFLVLSVVLLLVVIKGYSDQGGFSEVWMKNYEKNQTQIFIYTDSETRMTVWPVIFGSLALNLNGYTRQSVFQRCMSNQNIFKAKSAMVMGQTLIAASSVIMQFIGLCMYAKYCECDPVLSGQAKTRDQTVIMFAAETLSFGKGLLGLYFAGLICGCIRIFLRLYSGVTHIGD